MLVGAKLSQNCRLQQESSAFGTAQPNVARQVINGLAESNVECKLFHGLIEKFATLFKFDELTQIRFLSL